MAIFETFIVFQRPPSKSDGLLSGSCFEYVYCLLPIPLQILYYFRFRDIHCMLLMTPGFEKGGLIINKKEKLTYWPMSPLVSIFSRVGPIFIILFTDCYIMVALAVDTYSLCFLEASLSRNTRFWVSVCLSELACDDDICTPPLRHAFVHFLY